MENITFIKNNLDQFVLIGLNSEKINHCDSNKMKKSKLVALSKILIVCIFMIFQKQLKAQTFFFTPGWSSAPCDVEFKVFDASSNLLLRGFNNNIIFPSGNCFTGVPSYVEYTVSLYSPNPITVSMNSSVTVPLLCLGGASYTFTAYFNSSGLGCPQETLILNY